MEISYTNYIINEEISNELNMLLIQDIVTGNRLRFTGHILSAYYDVPRGVNIR